MSIGSVFEGVKMRFIPNIVILVGILCQSSSDSQSQVKPFQTFDHVHLYADRHLSSEADRFMGMYFLSQCQKGEARIWLLRALRHDPSNDAARGVMDILSSWTKAESMRRYNEAKVSGGDMTDYLFALICDPDNVLAQHEVARILKERDTASIEVWIKR
jgi:hypothetical protein